MSDHNIVVSAKTRFLSEHSDPMDRRFVFAYTITISNQGDTTAQLISRYWKIKDTNNKTQEVEGTGVVGEQPIIHAGKSYTYTSSAILETESGTMQGYYLMRKDNGDHFQASIPTFALVPAHAIH